MKLQTKTFLGVFLSILFVCVAFAEEEDVVSALVDKYGIAADRLKAKGVGPLSPVSTNKTEEGRKLNRRVELVEM